MKSLYRIISVVLTTAIVYTSCCAVADSGVIDEEPGYIPPPGIQVAPKTLVIEKVPEAPKLPVTPPEPAPQPQPEPEPTPEPKPAPEPAPPPPEQQAPIEQEEGFISKIIQMVIALCKTIALIIGLVGAYILYKKFMTKKLVGAAVKAPGEEPKTVEEAISSYIKHKLKK